MGAYRIKKLGEHVIVGTDEEQLLICADLDVARRAVADAECAPTLPTWQLLSQRAARIGEEAALAADSIALLADLDDGDEDNGA
jgi:hypothetical protein